MLTACNPGFSGALKRLQNGKVVVAFGRGQPGSAASTIGEARGAAESKLRIWGSATEEIKPVLSGGEVMTEVEVIQVWPGHFESGAGSHLGSDLESALRVRVGSDRARSRTETEGK